MRFFLDTQIGDGTQNNPFTAAHADYDVGLMGALRLGPSGLWLVGSTETSGQVFLDFGDTLDQTLPPNIRRVLGNRLGLTLDQTDFRAIIAELFLLHGREDGTRWRPLKQNSQGRHKIWLGGQVVYDAPIIQGTTLQDTFVEASDTDLTAHTATGPNSGFTWAYVAGDGVAGDVIVRASTDRAEETASDSAARYRISSDLASDDHFVQFEAHAWPTSTVTSIGSIVRYEAAADTGYAMLLRDRTNNKRYRIFEMTTGSFTELASLSENLPTEPATAYFEVDGSSLEIKMDDVSKVTVTDTTHTGQLRTGLHFSNDCEIDDFIAEDLAAVAVTRFIRSNLVSRKPLKKDDDRLASQGLISAGKST